MSSILRTLHSSFPLYYNPPIPPPSRSRRIQVDETHDPSSAAVLWITPPARTQPTVGPRVLSGDVECIKWQAYLALRGVRGVRIRSDVDPAGAVDGRFPSLWIPQVKQGEAGILAPSTGKVMSARMIPGWADEVQGKHPWGEVLEGYVDERAKDESRAWVAVLEGVVHAALLSHQPPPSFLQSWLFSEPSPTEQLSTLLVPPPAPLTGLSTLFSPYGVNIPTASLQVRYHEAICALSERLGTDKWFLGSSNPTPLDALLFAYLHVALHPRSKGQERARAEVIHRVNLVAWEQKVRTIVEGAFRPLHDEGGDM